MSKLQRLRRRPWPVSVSEGHVFSAGARAGGRCGHRTGAAVVAGSSLGAGAGPVGHSGRQGDSACRCGGGQCGRWARALARLGHGARRDQRDSGGPSAVGPTGLDRQDRPGRRGPYPSGNGAADSLRRRGGLSADRQREPRNSLSNRGNAADPAAFFPRYPRSGRMS